MRVLHDILQAAEVLREGNLLAFPTDTVCGLGISVAHAHGLDALFSVKQRETGKPVAWLVGSADDLERFGEAVPEYARRLAQEFWPGALTLVVRASNAVPLAFLSGASSIGLRMPAHQGVRSLIGELDCPLATSSANVSGCPAPAFVADIDPVLASRLGYALDFGEEQGREVAAARSGEAKASTVVDCTGVRPVVLREGGIPREALFRAAACSLDSSSGCGAFSARIPTEAGSMPKPLD